jgi:hypothetical protein
MVNVITLLSDERIQYEGLFDIKELYKHAHNWLTWRKFDVSEKQYTEKVKASGKELDIKWEATKFIDEYSAFKIKIRWQIFGMNDVEVKQGAETVKMQKGELNIYITANLETDRQDYWAQNAFYSFLRAFYDRYLYRSTIERLKAELWKLGWDYYNELKSFLNLYKYK